MAATGGSKGGGGHGGEASGVTGAGSQMTTQLPDGLQKFFKVTLGMTWPEGSEGGLHQMSDAWYAFQTAAKERVAEIEAMLPRLDASIRGDTANGLKAYLNDVKENLKKVEAASGEFGKMSNTAAADIQKAKIMLIAMALMVLATVISLIASLFGAFAVPGVLAAGRVALQAIWNALVRKIMQMTWQKAAMGLGRLAWQMGKYAAGGAAFMGGLDLGIQTGQLIDNKLHGGHGGRDDIDWDSVKGSVIGGAIGGAAFGAFHGAAKGLGGIAKGAGKGGGPKNIGGKGPGAGAGKGGGAQGGGKGGEGAGKGGEGAGKGGEGAGKKGFEEKGYDSNGFKTKDDPKSWKNKLGGRGMEGDPPGWVRGLGQLGYAGAQIGMAAASNPIVNKATGHDDDIWAGILGGAAPFHASKGMSAKLDAKAGDLANSFAGKFGMKFDQPGLGLPGGDSEKAPLLGGEHSDSDSSHGDDGQSFDDASDTHSIADSLD